MSFLSNIKKMVEAKASEMKERKEFLDLVEDKAKPVRRAAYMKQMLKEVVEEGRAKAIADAKAKRPAQKKTESDFGLDDPYKFLNKSNGNKK